MGRHKIVRYCKHCGGEFFRTASQSAYCSRDCSLAHGRDAWASGARKPAVKVLTGRWVTCPACGKQIYRFPSELHITHCSNDCYWKSYWGPDGKPVRHCVICGAAFTTKAVSDMTVTCSKACSRERRASYCGPLSHSWQGGKSRNYVGGWKRQRRIARERDGFACRICKSTESICVHHTIPYRYSQSHDLDNLVCLCRQCHTQCDRRLLPYLKRCREKGRKPTLRKVRELMFQPTLFSRAQYVPTRSGAG